MKSKSFYSQGNPKEMVPNPPLLMLQRTLGRCFRGEENACRAAWVAHVSVISDTGLPISGSPLYKIPALVIKHNATQSSHCTFYLCNMKFTR